MKKLPAPPEDKKPILLNRSFAGLTVQHLRYQWGDSSVYPDAPDMLSVTLAVRRNFGWLTAAMFMTGNLRRTIWRFARKRSFGGRF
jgi:hypothetical protein